MGSLLRTFWTIRYLRPRQIVDRITRRLVRPRIDPRPAPPRRIPILGRPSFLAKVPSFLGDHRFLFLNEIRRVDPGDFAVSKPGLLWDYNFHYFDSLLAPCPCDEEKREWVLNWIRSVPAGSRPGWDPYPTSRRISNWIKWALASSLDPPPEFLHSLAAQARYLQQQLEYHLMGNHLLANATALTLAGTFFGGEEGDRWFRRGTRLLHQELLGQFCADGAHHELSTTYHSVVLEDLLDLVSVARTMGVNLPDLVARTAAAAARWVHLMTRPDGNLPLFNDASYGASADPQDLREYAEALGLHQLVPIPPGLALMEGSGYFRYARGRLFVIGDVGELGPDYQPGHAHCDMLSFELCWDQRPILVDTGTSTYELGERRILERSTASHNTVQVGDMEQSEIWAAFRVARRGRIETRRLDSTSVRASIRGFPPNWSRHSRAWTFENETLRVLDEVTNSSRGRETPIARLHFHPSVILRGSDTSWTANRLNLRVDGADQVRKVEYLFAPEFNRLVPSEALEITFGNRLLTTFFP